MQFYDVVLCLGLGFHAGFQDESWPVRDAACIACGRFVSKFPEESGPRIEQLYKLFLDHVCKWWRGAHNNTSPQ